MHPLVISKKMPAEAIPYELLLLADPSKTIIDNYIYRGQVYIARIDDRVVGVYVLLSTRPEMIELVNVAVAEQEQGKGIGQQLVNHAIITAQSQGFKTIEVGTGNSSIGQLAMYQKCGFRITGIDMDFFVKHYSEEIIENGIICRDMIRLAQDLF